MDYKQQRHFMATARLIGLTIGLGIAATFALGVLTIGAVVLAALIRSCA